MITTAVQQSSQIVEVQGAPPAIQTVGDNFRAAFAASVSDSAAQKAAPGGGEKLSGSTVAQAGLTSSKQVLAGLLARNESIATGVAKQSLLQSKANELDETATETATDASASSDVEESTVAALKSAATTDVSEAVTLTKAPGLAALTQAGQASAAKALDSSALNLPVAAADPAGLVAGLKSSKSADAAVAPSRKDELSASKKGSSADTAPATASGGTRVDISAGQAQPVTVPTVYLSIGLAGEASTSQSEGKAGVLTDVIQANVAKASSGSSPAGGKIGATSLAAAGFDEVASLQPGPLSVQDTNVPDSGTNKAASGKAVLPAREATQSVEVVAARQVPAEVGSSTKANFSAPTYGTTSATPDAFTGSISTSKQPVNGLGENGVEAKVSSRSTVTATAVTATAVAATATQTKTAVQPHSGLAAKAVGDAQPSSTNLASNEVASGLTSASAAQVSTPGGSTSTLVQGKVSDSPGAAQAAAVGASVPEAASKVTAAAANDEKTKTAVAASADTSAASLTAAQPSAGDPQSASISNSAAHAGDTSGRAIAGTDAVNAIPAGTQQLSSSSAHTGAGAVVPGATGRTSAGNAASQPESAAAIAQGGEPHRTLLATPNTLEVGVQSGTQGWLRIRAEVGDQGQVNASLTAGSSGARELLHNQMPALNAFLHSEQMSVTTTVAEHGFGSKGESQLSAGTGSGGLSSQSGSGGSNGSLLQGGEAQSNGTQRETPRQSVIANAADTARGYTAQSGVSEVEGLSSERGRGTISEDSGRWLNVRV